MAEVLTRFDERVRAKDGGLYRAQACGAPGRDGLWEAWIEFQPDGAGGGAAVRTPRETTQPNRTDTVYWATGLTAVYLEGALERALHPLVAHAAPPRAEPMFGGPAPDFAAAPTPAVRPSSILDPFSVYEKGEGLLRQELAAMASWHLVDILIKYELTDLSVATLNQLRSDALIDLIVSGVRRREAVR